MLGDVLKGLGQVLNALASLGAWIVGRRQGATNARLHAAEAALQARSKADAIDDHVARANRAAIDHELRTYTRD